MPTGEGDYINKIPFYVMSKLSKALDAGDKWRDLLATIDEAELDGPPLEPDYVHVLENCFKRRQSPTETLLNELGVKGYKVRDLKHWLRLAELNQALYFFEGTTKEISSNNSAHPHLGLTPSDIGLSQVVSLTNIVSSFEKLPVLLGIPLASIQSGPLSNSDVLTYWRDGNCGSDFPNTWKFLLKNIEASCGSVEAKAIEEALLSEPTWCYGNSIAEESFQKKYIEELLKISTVAVITAQLPQNYSGQYIFFAG